MEDKTSSRQAKLQKLTKLRKNIPHTSKSALEKILKHIKDEGLPELDNSKQMREGCQMVLNNMQGYGPLLLEHQLVTSTGGLSKVILVNLLSWLHGAYKAGGGFHALLKSTMACNPGPLSLLVYADEVCPGNVLSHQPARKLWCIYVSIKQFHTALQKEAAWITVGLVRSDVVASLDGHLSAVLAALLGSIFNSEFGNVTHLGLLLQEPPGRGSLGNRLFLDLGFFIMDGQAAKFAWSTKGDFGSRFCQQCANVFQITADPDLEDEAAPLSEIAKHQKFADLHLVSDAQIFRSWDRMKGRSTHATKQDFQLWEQACGISFSSHAILANEDLRHILKPTQQNCWDRMHCLLSNGVVNLALYNFLEKLDQWQLLSGYVQQFQLPKSLASIKMAQLFESKRLAKNKKHKKIIATASELLTLSSLVAHYIRVVCIPANACLEEAHAFLSLVLLMDLLQATWLGGVTPGQLLEAAENSLSACVSLEWKLIKKHHWMLHFHQMLANHKCIPNTFCMERKNKLPSRVATLIQNLKVFENSVYSEVITLELERVSHPDVFASHPGLLQPRPVVKKLMPLALQILTTVGDCLSSNHARCKYGTCSKGDVVYLSGQSNIPFEAAEVLGFLENGDAVALVNILQLHKMCETFAEWIDQDMVQAVPLQEVLTAVTFAKGKQKITTLTPWHFRQKAKALWKAANWICRLAFLGFSFLNTH